MRISTYLLAVALAGVLSVPAFGQYQKQEPQATKSGRQAAAQSSNMNDHGGAVNTAEQEFVTKAAQADRAEVELGRMALQKSNNPEIKQFAQRMIDDHSQNQQQVDSLAAKLSINKQGLSAEQQQEADRLSRLSGDQFDRAYAKLMLEDHRKDVGEFQREQRTAKDSEVKSYIDQTLPVLQQHLQMAEKLNKTK